MNISLVWLNALLDRPVTADEVEHALTFTGFPIESRTAVAARRGEPADTLLDVEITSNRGDCLSHVGLAREVAAATGRRLRAVAGRPAPEGGGAIGESVSLVNLLADEGGCPLFTLRMIRGIRVGPSPAWLAARLEAVGQRSINNIVDASNYVLFEMGNPSHVFDLRTIAADASGKHAVVVRSAAKGEGLTLLDGKAVELRPGEMVVADGRAATSLAGVMGGQNSGVGEGTTDVLVEIATWAPARVRAAARRLNLRTDAGHRFERLVDPGTIAGAMERLVSLIVEVAGGRAAPGTLSAGRAEGGPGSIGLRPARMRAVLGAAISDEEARGALVAQGVAVGGGGEAWACTRPAHRPDLKIEADLIEEVARTVGLHRLPVAERVAVAVKAPQATERARGELGRVLTGMGFLEAVTFSFVSEKQARQFVPPGMATLAVSDARRAGEGTLRPSVIPSLLACRARNQHAKSAAAGSVRLFECASVYGETVPGGHVENRNLALVADLAARGGPQAGSAFEQRQHGLRLMRTVLEAAVGAVNGGAGGLGVVAGPVPFAALEAGAGALLTLGGKPWGVMGLVSAACLGAFEIEHPVVVAEVNEGMLLEGYPPRARAAELPRFPATERDLTLDVDEAVAWARVEREVAGAGLRWCEGLGFVSAYRGKSVPAGKKAVTLKLTFREATRTLTDDEVNGQMAGLVARLKERVGASVRV